MKSNRRAEKRKVQKNRRWILRTIDKCVIKSAPRHVKYAHLILLPKGSVLVITYYTIDANNQKTRTDWTSIECRNPERDFSIIRNYYKQVDITEIMVEISLGALSETAHTLWCVLGESKADIFCWPSQQEF